MKRVFSLLLAILLFCGMLPQLCVPVQAAEHLLDAAQVDGRQYSPLYAEKLNQIFRGEVALFTNSDVRYPLGSSMNNGASYTVAGTISGYQCYIYAQAVYFYLFGDLIYHGDGYKFWSNSTQVLHNKTTVSYDLFLESGVGFGAYIRTTTSSSGAYNGNKGHSVIVLDYDEQGITFLEGNADGKGLVRITEMTWEEFNDVMLTSKGRRIAHVVQYNDTACRHPEYTQMGNCVRCGEAYAFEYSYSEAGKGYYTVAAQEGVTLCPQPYHGEQTDGVLLTEGAQILVQGSITNALGESWYQLSYEDATLYVPIEGLEKDHITPGTPELRCVGEPTDSQATVFTWETTENTTHYELSVQRKNAEGQWEAYVQSPDAQSGEEVSLSVGEYCVQLRAFNAQEQTDDAVGCIYADSKPVYLTVIHSHSFKVMDVTFATCTQDGVEKSVCLNCGQWENKVFPAEGHYYVNMRCEACDAPEPAIVTVEVSPKADTGKPVLTWNGVTSAKKYEVWRATSENGKYTRQKTTTGYTYTDTKATAGKTYYYKVKVVSSQKAYNGVYSAAVACATACARPSVTIKVDSATGKPSLSWKSVTGAVGYQILRRLPGEDDFTQIAQQTGKTYMDKLAPVDARCEYKVLALGKQAQMNSAQSTVAAITARCAQPVLKSEVTQDGKPVISWNAVEGAVAYKVYRSTKSGSGYTVIATTAEQTYIDDSAVTGKSYYYKVAAASEKTTGATSSYKKAAGKCATPELAVQTGETGKPVLTWNKITGAKKYEIYRSTNGGSFKKVTTTTKLTYTDTKAGANTTCTYKIRALGASSSYHSQYSAVDSSVVLCGQPSLSAKLDTVSGKPSLSWKKISGASGYRIYRAEDGQNYLPIATQKTVSYLDQEAVAGVTYSYKVVALGKQAAFDSRDSVVKTVAATCAQPKLKGKLDSQGKPMLVWGEVEGAEKYVVYRSTSKSKGYQELTQTQELSWTDATAVKNKTYYYKVIAVAQNANSIYSGYVKLKSK